jgi:hypothetical protein
MGWSGQPYFETTSGDKMTVAVNPSRNGQETEQQTQAAPGEQAQWKRDVRSGPWPVTMLEIGKGIQDVLLHLVGQMLKL